MFRMSAMIGNQFQAIVSERAAANTATAQHTTRQLVMSGVVNVQTIAADPTVKSALAAQIRWNQIGRRVNRPAK